MEAGDLVWVRNKTLLKNKLLTEDLWLPGVVHDATVSTDAAQRTYVIDVQEKHLSFVLPAEAQESADIKPRHGSTQPELENFVDLPYLNEPEIVVNLKARYERNLIFTYTGPILLAINPSNEVIPAVSCERLMLQFVAQVCHDVSKEIVVAKQHHSVPTKHSILISGESGSGKSETFKLILKSFGYTPGYDDQEYVHVFSKWFDKLLLANQVLESFGNAKTERTSNSTRFGKLLGLQLDGSGQLVTSTIRTYLLESSRTSSQQQSERNFNIFYELLAGMSWLTNTSTSEWQTLQKKFNVNMAVFQSLSQIKARGKPAWTVLGNAEQYFYVNQQQAGAAAEPSNSIPEQEQRDHDRRKFFELFTSLHQLNIDVDTMLSLFDIVLAIVFLGEIRFVDLNDASDGCEIACTPSVEGEEKQQPVEVAAELLGISSESLAKLLTTKTIATTREETIERKFSVANAVIARDAIARALYKHVFDYVVLLMNQQLNASALVAEETTNEVYILDFFGFDSFTHNSLEQLCINYANETLQQIFNHHIFKLELALYQAEGIVFEAATFADNQDNVDLIANCIFPIVDDQCRIPNPSDKRLVAQLYRDLQSNELFSANTTQQLSSKFSIQHFAGQVEYSIDHFIVKNTDNLPTDTAKVFSIANNSLLTDMFAASTSPAMATTSNKSRSTANTQLAPSFVAQVKVDLQLLTKEIEPTIAHYVRCIKPFHEEAVNSRLQTADNDAAVSDVEEDVSKSNSAVLGNRSTRSKRIDTKKIVRFDQNKVAEQLRYSGLLSALQTKKVGYRSHQLFADFYSRYRIIAANMKPPSDSSLGKFAGPVFLPKDRPPETVQQLCEDVIRYISLPLKCLRSDIYTLLLAKDKLLSSHNMVSSLSSTDDNVVVAANKIVFGHSMVFLHKVEFDQLETLRNFHVLADIVFLQRQLRRFRCRVQYVAKRDSAKLLNRVLRGFWARLQIKRMRAQMLIAYTLQRRVRKFLFICKVIRMQSAYRCYQARLQAASLRVRRQQLLTLYGPMLQSRELRLTRRRNHQHLQTVVMDAKTVPTADQRNRKYREEEELLNKEILEIVADSKLSDDLHEGMTDFSKMLTSLFALTQALNTSSLLPPTQAKVKLTLLQFVNKCKRAEHLLNAKQVVEKSWFRRIFGAFRLSNAAANLDYAVTTTVLDSQHPIFTKLLKTIRSMEDLKVLVDEEAKWLEDQRQHLRLHGHRGGAGNAEAGSTDELIAEVNNQLHYLRKITVLCDNLPQYYRQYMLHFCQEYNQDSVFGRSFETDEAYLQGLLAVVKTAKRTAAIKPQLADASQQFTQHSLQAMYTPLQQCPLRVDWKEGNDLVDQEMSTLNQVKDMAMGDILRTITLLELKKRDFQIDNLRVLEVKDVGYHYNPPTPGIGFAINAMQHLLQGKIINARRLIRLTKTGGKNRVQGSKVTYYQACATMKKHTMLDVLYHPVAIEQLDSVSFSTTFLSCCLFGLTQVQPNNLFTAPDKNYKAMFNMFSNQSSPAKGRSPLTRGLSVQKSMRVARSNSQRFPLNRQASVSTLNTALDQNKIAITGFNPDIHFNKMFIDYDEEEELRKPIHAMNMNVLFFLPQMDEPLDVEVKQLLIGSPFKVEEILSSWLRDLHEQNMRYQHLQSIGFAEEDLKALQLPIKLSHGTVLEVYKRLQFIVRMLRNEDAVEHVEKRVTLDDLLTVFYPQLAAFYRQLRHDSYFTEGTNLKGVTSYAYIYHNALDKERARLAQRYADTSKPEEGSPQLDVDDKKSMSASNNSIMRKTYKNRRGSSSKGDIDNTQIGTPRRTDTNEQIEDTSSKLTLADEEKSGKEASPLPRSARGRQLGRQPVTGENPRILREYSKRFTPGESFNFDHVYNSEGIADTVKGSKMNIFAVDEVKYEAPLSPFRKTTDKLVLKRLTLSSKFNMSFSGSSDKKKKKGNGLHSVGEEEQHSLGYDSVYGGDSTDNTTATSPVESNEFRHQLAAKKRPSTFSSTLASASVEEVPGSPASFSSPTTDFAKLSRVSELNETLESEGLEFLTRLDWRLFLPSSNASHAKHPSQFSTREQAVVFCSNLGKNFTFLPMLWLNFVNEWQLKAFFQYWLRLIRSKELDKSRVKLVTTELVIRFDCVEDMEALKDASILLKLRRKLNIDIKFAILLTEENSKDDEDDNGEEAFDIYAFDATYENEHLHYESEDDHDDFDHLMTAEDKELRRQLLKVLWTCSNLTCGEDIDQVEREVIVVKTVIMQLTSGTFRQFPLQTYPMLDEEAIEDFIPILLSYPALAKVGEEVAKCFGFRKKLLVVHQMLAHSLVDRYIPVILMLLKQHPEALWLIDPSQGYLPCDRMKKLPDNKFWKYKTYANIVNLAGELTLPFIRKFSNSASNFGSIVTRYSGEEELIMLAARYQIKCTDVELRTKRFDFNKRYQPALVGQEPVLGLKTEESLLWRLLISECRAKEDDQDSRDAAWYVYDLFIRVVKERMTYAANGFTVQSAADMILRSLHVNTVDKACLQYYKLTDHVLTSSRILEDIRLFWFPKYQADSLHITATAATMFFHKKALGKHFSLQDIMP